MSKYNPQDYKPGDSVKIFYSRTWSKGFFTATVQRITPSGILVAAKEGGAVEWRFNSEGNEQGRRGMERHWILSPPGAAELAADIKAAGDVLRLRNEVREELRRLSELDASRAAAEMIAGMRTLITRLEATK